jgi:hypothetical protein
MVVDGGCCPAEVVVVVASWLVEVVAAPSLVATVPASPMSPAMPHPSAANASKTVTTADAASRHATRTPLFIDRLMFDASFAQDPLGHARVRVFMFDRLFHGPAAFR